MGLQAFDNWEAKPVSKPEGTQKKVNRVSKCIRIEIEGNHTTIHGETMEISPVEFRIKITDGQFLTPDILASPEQCRAKIEQEFAYGMGIHFPDSDASYNGRVSPDREPGDPTVIICILDREMDFDSFLKLKANGDHAGGVGGPMAPPAQSPVQEQNPVESSAPIAAPGVGQAPVGAMAGQNAHEVEVWGGSKAFKALALNLSQGNVQILITDNELRMPEGPGKSVFINKIITDYFIKGFAVQFRGGEISIKADPVGVSEVTLEGKQCTVIESNFRRELTQEDMVSITSGPQSAGAAEGAQQVVQAEKPMESAQPAIPTDQPAAQSAPAKIPTVASAPAPTAPAAQSAPAEIQTVPAPAVPTAPAAQSAPAEIPIVPAPAVPTAPAAQSAPAGIPIVPAPAVPTAPAAQSAPAGIPIVSAPAVPTAPAAQSAPAGIPIVSTAPAPTAPAAQSAPAGIPTVPPPAAPTAPVVQSAPVEAPAPTPPAAPRGGAKTNMRELMKSALERGATDLHIKAGRPLRARIAGQLVDFSTEKVTPELTKAMAHDLMSPEQAAIFEQEKDVELSCTIESVGRFRVSIFRQQDSTGLAVRCLQRGIPTIESLGLHASAATLSEKPHGLVLVTGPAGSGKSTTLAAMVDHVNRTRPCHIITLEGPIEYIHADGKAQITQRDIGRDALGYSRALQSALRQDPDVILLGEMGDPETFSLALTAAESGRLVLASLNASTAAQALARMIAGFHPDLQAEIRIRLAESLQGILAQQLVPAAGGSSLTLEQEALMADKAVCAFIRENKMSQITETMQKTADDLAQAGQSAQSAQPAQTVQVQKNLQALQDAKAAKLPETVLDRMMK